jgi:hypothetical protein
MAVKKTSILHYGYIDSPQTYACVLMLERMTRQPWAHTTSYHKIATLQCPTLGIILHHKTHPWIRDHIPLSDLYMHIVTCLQDARVQFHASLHVITADTHAIGVAVAEGMEISYADASSTHVDYYDEPRKPAEWMQEDAAVMPYRTWTLTDLMS